MLAKARQPAPIRYAGLNVSSSVMDVPVPVFWGQRRLATNAMDYVDFQRHSSSGGKGKGGGGKGQQSYDYTAATVRGLCEGPVDSIARAFTQASTTTTTTLSDLNMTLFTGTAIQSPWSFMATNFPGHARAYAYTAYLACPKEDLGQAAQLPDIAFETVRANGFSYTHTTAGWIDPETHVQASAIDVLLSDCALDMLTSVQYGALLAAGDIGSMVGWATYMRAQGLFFSPLLNQAEKATQVLDRWAQLSNSWIFDSGTQLQFVPLGDSAITANGVTYTPDTAVAYDLGLADFLDAEQPVKVTRKDPADCFNRCVLNITDRTIGYVSNPLEYKDQTLTDLYGLRDGSNVQADEVCDPVVGKIVVQLVGKRAAYVRKGYSFKIPYRYIRVLPGAILTLTTRRLDHERVRVTDVEEDDDGVLSVQAEEFPGLIGTFVAASASAADASGQTTPNQLTPPGPVNTPALAEPDSTFTGGVAKILIAASGGANWGGAQVHVSFDGTSYSHIGTIEAPAVQGLLTANLADHADPDSANTLSVDCTESGGIPAPVTHADADAGRTLSLVAAQPVLSGGAYVVPTNGELLAFGDVAATATYAADLTYLRRGLYGQAHAAHTTGDQFTVLDILGQSQTTLSYQLPQQYVGQPMWLKFASFNAFGLALEDLSLVAEYKYTPTGRGFGTATGGVPAIPTWDGAPVPAANQVALAWHANPTQDNVTSYTLFRAPGPGGSFGAALPIWTGLALNDIDAGLASSTDYTYYLEARNAIGASGPSAGADATTGAATGGSVTRITVSSSPHALGTPPALNWYVDVTNSFGAAIELDLPGTPATGQVIVLTDEGGNAGTYPQTIKSGATTIDTITVNNGWSRLRWNGAAWLRG
jgi:hypothetical protein